MECDHGVCAGLSARLEAGGGYVDGRRRHTTILRRSQVASVRDLPRVAAGCYPMDLPQAS